VTPKEYCEKWLPILYGIDLSERGSKKVAIAELSRVLKIPESTIRNWGSDFERAPVTVHTTLSYADLLQSTSESWQRMTTEDE
jgi:hypothetical protein